MAIIFLARVLVGIFERPMLEAELIKSFYQVENQTTYPRANGGKNNSTVQPRSRLDEDLEDSEVVEN